MNKNIIFKRADSITYETVADEAILIDMTTGTYFSLNQVGSMFWQEINGQITLAKIAVDITAHFNAQANKLAAELAALAKSSGQPNALSLQTLAEMYDMEVETVAEFLKMVQDGGGETAVIIQQLTIEPKLVEDDLLELAQTMLTDNLIDQVAK